LLTPSEEATGLVPWYVTCHLVIATEYDGTGPADEAGFFRTKAQATSFMGDHAREGWASTMWDLDADGTEPIEERSPRYVTSERCRMEGGFMSLDAWQAVHRRHRGHRSLPYVTRPPFGCPARPGIRRERGGIGMVDRRARAELAKVIAAQFGYEPEYDGASPLAGIFLDGTDDLGEDDLDEIGRYLVISTEEAGAGPADNSGFFDTRAAATKHMSAHVREGWASSLWNLDSGSTEPVLERSPR